MIGPTFNLKTDRDMPEDEYRSEFGFLTECQVRHYVPADRL